MPTNFGRLQFAWETLASAVEGESAIDVPRLHVASLAEAEDFLECYGYDVGVESQRLELDSLRQQGIAFLDEELLDDEPSLEIPPDVRAQSDVRQLLVWASQPPRDQRQKWTCSLLRVMHTLAHCRTPFNERYGAEIRRQVIARFDPHVFTDEDGNVGLGRGPDRIELVSFEIKHRKPMRSVAMKLLHKVENVATDIFDRIGMRFVTKHRFDVLLVVQYLMLHNVVMFANLKPSRSRNTLLRLDSLRRDLSYLDNEIRAGRLNAYEKLDAIRALTEEQPLPDSATGEYNRHTAKDYQSIQFTGRHLIRIPNGLDGFGGPAPLSMRDSLLNLPALPRRGTRDLCFFFPYEIQIMDEAAWEASRSGYASHSEYKKRQRATVKARVLGPLLIDRKGTA